MINKRGLWFLTLFSLILVLGVYYITMPQELLLGNNSSYVNKEKDNEKADNDKKEPVVEVQESDILVALRVEHEEKLEVKMQELQSILVNAETSIDEKNTAYDKMKSLNITRGEEENLEKKILEEYKLKSFVKVTSDQVRVVVASDKHDSQLANKIMRTIQSNYENKMYISVKFQK